MEVGVKFGREFGFEQDDAALREPLPAQAEKQGLKDYNGKIGKDLTWGGTVFDVALIIAGALLCFAGYKLVKFAFILTGLAPQHFG